VIDRRDGVNGELVLRRMGAHHEVIANGTFLMDTRDGRSERTLVREAVAGLHDARLAADAGVAVFRAAFERWVDEDEDREFGRLVSEALDRLVAVVRP
jgi:hypothetical protein